MKRWELVAATCCLFYLQVPNLWSDEPANVAVAAQVLDLSEFPLVAATEENHVQIVARQLYRSQSGLPEVADLLRQQLRAVGCVEAEGGTFSEAYGSAVYTKDSFTWSLTLSPGPQPGQTNVSIINHGNVPLSSLPAPEDGQILFSFPNTIAYVSPTTPTELLGPLRTKWIEAGWTPYGDTRVSFFMKKNAVLAQIMVTPAPPNSEQKSTVQITTELMSVDLPAWDYDGPFQYSDANGSLLFDSGLSQDDLVADMSEKLGLQGWSPTTDAPIKIGFRHHLIFRNPAQDYLEVTFQSVQGKTRADLRYQTAKQFRAREDRAAGNRGK